MINPAEFVEWLAVDGIDFYTGVPDSLLKGFGNHVMASLPRERHVIAANEGNAVALAMGYHLRTGATPLVYLQNSGIGNAINPLLSLADPEVYGIPMVLLVGWRGRPGGKDEPQHRKQGRVMTSLLDSIEIPWTLLPDERHAARSVVTAAIADARSRRAPHVVLVEKGTFGNTAMTSTNSFVDLSTRESAVMAAVKAIGHGIPIIATTGMLGRELFETRATLGRDGSLDFLTVGGMGHASSIALGVALAALDGEVWCLDGDGALLMHMGSLATTGDRAPDRYFHVIFNNGVHDSVGGQPTSIGAVDIPAVAAASGYRWSKDCINLNDLPQLVAEMRRVGGPALLELKVKPGSRRDLGRPTRTPTESRTDFMAAFSVE